jgi:predicted glycosyltransferase
MRVKKKRILLYAYDGTGLGHLMRLIKIASGLKNDFLPLIVSGHKIIGDIIFDGIEYIRIPNYNAVSFVRTTQIDEDSINIEKMRRKNLWNIMKTFKPHALITDFLPSGKKDELLDLIMNYDCIKYLILRGEIGKDEIFTKHNNELLNIHFSKIFVTCDKTVTDLDNREDIPVCLKQKFLYTGYIAVNVSDAQVQSIRETRLQETNNKWIVCSAGGGKLGESLIENCVALSKRREFKNCQFDIIHGYYSALKWAYTPYNNIQIDNVRLSKNISNLYLLHASADAVICSGGYNSLIESIQGNSKHIFSYSVQNGNDEQSENINKLKQYLPITEIENINDIEKLLLAYNWNTVIKYSNQINCNGIENIDQQIKTDTGYVTNL